MWMPVISLVWTIVYLVRRRFAPLKIMDMASADIESDLVLKNPDDLQEYKDDAINPGGIVRESLLYRGRYPTLGHFSFSNFFKLLIA